MDIALYRSYTRAYARPLFTRRSKYAGRPRGYRSDPDRFLIHQQVLVQSPAALIFLLNLSAVTARLVRCPAGDRADAGRVVGGEWESSGRRQNFNSALKLQRRPSDALKTSGHRAIAARRPVEIG